MNIQQSIQQVVSELYGSEIQSSQIQLQKTKKEFKGHFTFVVFPLLKLSRKSPEQTAQEIGERLLKGVPGIAAYQVVKGFLNLTFAPSHWIQLFNEMYCTESFGTKKREANAPLVMIEYSSPNTNKPLHLGHIRNNLLGYSLSEILQANGKRVIKTNIVNDRGIHICKSMLAWKKWGRGETPESTGKKGDHLIGDYYVKFDREYKKEIAGWMESGLPEKEAESQSALMAEAREMLRQWEAEDPETVALWKKMNDWVYAGFDETYKALGVAFDKIYYESQTYIFGKEKVLEGLANGLFYRKADGSVWADLTAEGLDEKLLLRSDGTSVYITQDIGTAKLRFDDYPIDQMIYVVGNEQNYHFQVLSLLLDRLGYAFGKGLIHFSYGMVELPEGKMKSREGTVVDADDLMAEMIGTARDIANELGKTAGYSEKNIDEIARMVGMGALKYFILKVDPRKNMVFNPQESIDFNGNTGPFIQYTYARIQSVLRRSEIKFSEEKDHPVSLETPINEKEEDLIQLVSEFPSIIEEAANNLSPSIVANYLYDLVKEYNQFYHDYSILREENAELRRFRLLLSRQTGKVIETGLRLLGIEAPDRM